jgi:hypothetical protein
MPEYFALPSSLSSSLSILAHVYIVLAFDNLVVLFRK